MENEDGLLPANTSRLVTEYEQYDTINIVISFMYLGIIMLPSVSLGSFISTAITVYKPYPTPHNILIVHTLLCEVVYAITRGISFVFTITEIISNIKPSFSCRFTDALLRLLVMLTHTNLAAMIFITFYGVSYGMQNLKLKHGTRLIVVQWIYSLTWITLHHFILGPDITKQTASRCIFHINSIDIGGFVLAVFTGMVTVIVSTLLVIIFSALTHFKVKEVRDVGANALIKSIQTFTLWNGIVFALLAIPTTIFYWIAPLFIDFDETGAAVLPQAVSYVILEFITQVVIQIYLITDAINILLIFTEVRVANKKLMQQIIAVMYKVWKKRYEWFSKTNKVVPIAPVTSNMTLSLSEESTSDELRNE